MASLAEISSTILISTSLSSFCILLTKINKEIREEVRVSMKVRLRHFLSKLFRLSNAREVRLCLTTEQYLSGFCALSF